MNDESIIKLFENSNLDNLDDELLEKLIPFLDYDSLHAVFERIMKGKSGAKLIEPMRSYIDHSLIETAWMHGMLEEHWIETKTSRAVGESDGSGKVMFKNIGKTYDNGIIAVTDFNLEIEQGEVVVFVGPSGCGKSTTLRMIAGLEEITGGELYIDGVLVNDVHPKDRNLAMLFQFYALFPHMTVYENIAFGLKPLELPEAEVRAKVEAIVRNLSIDMTNYLERYPRELSGGQKQRTALARMLIGEQKVMLLDEPFSNLDAKLRVSMKIELMKLHKQFKKTFIYVTHDQRDAMTVADKIVVMRDGIIQQVGMPEEVYAKPVNLFVAGFIGTPQMNFWDSEHDGKAVIKGVRPEDMYISEAGEIDAVVQVREFVGDRVYLHCQNDEQELIVSMGMDCEYNIGDKIKLAIREGKTYMFDKETELAIY